MFRCCEGHSCTSTYATDRPRQLRQYIKTSIPIAYQCTHIESLNQPSRQTNEIHALQHAQELLNTIPGSASQLLSCHSERSKDKNAQTREKNDTASNLHEQYTYTRCIVSMKKTIDCATCAAGDSQASGLQEKPAKESSDRSSQPRYGKPTRSRCWPGQARTGVVTFESSRRFRR